MGDMLALTAIENIGKYLVRAVKNGNDLEAREGVAFALNPPAGTTGTSTMVIKEADRFCLSPAGAAGIRNGVRRHRSFVQEMWFPFLWA